MINKFFGAIESLPIVRLLQLFAVVQFLSGLFVVIVNLSSQINEIFNGMHIFLMHVSQIFYSPLILLACAEIIKLLRKKQNDKN